MAEEEIIQFTGVAELGDAEKDMVNKLSTEYYQKIKMMMNYLMSYC